jgi:prepilin signal peptidase PulO-like enzyme (type II secretory pathway)
MGSLLNIPLEVRLAVLAIVGAALGGAVNVAVYRLAWHQRSYSPWSAPLEEALPRHWSDRIPVIGWFGLRREASLHGAGFWGRPTLVEMVTGVGLAALYWWEVDQQGLTGPIIAESTDAAVLHSRFAIHVFLLALMLAASLIDMDEKNIPDGITVPGTLVGLILATAFPWALLPVLVRASDGPMGVDAVPTWSFLRLTSPNPWPDWLGGFPHGASLAIALGCWWGWCFALMPRTWYRRHGWRRAVVLSLGRMRREPATYQAGGMGMIGMLLVAAIWWGSALIWEGLVTSLVGMAVGGGAVWAVRLIATAALRQEAMGFGDVTLGAMIGAFLGWQPCLIVFFLAVFIGLGIGVFSLFLYHEPEIPFGPSLCMGATIVVVGWCVVWARAERYFELGWILAAIVAVGLVMMGGLLWLRRAVLG